ncbi:hypothetical protein NE236_20365 [Actinoallomurus purpureus]|uniref:hypothetical protein n=1 Tax=Actinoallomurus purpureus TaxID=478114 RepID=UPI002093FC37|nr:hypothetical protein [Actinoallomurus purpureus]MCO6007338.1 hypothetical protein [Actinoallomurus purpureus]
MNDLIKITIGRRPWLPSEDAEAVAEFDRYNFPTCGIIRQRGELFVFDCVDRHVMEGNVWVYAHVSEDEAEMLMSASGAELLDALDVAFRGRPVMGVLAIDGKVRSGTVVSEEDIATKGIGQALLDELRKGRDVATEAASALADLVRA